MDAVEPTGWNELVIEGRVIVNNGVKERENGREMTRNCIPLMWLTIIQLPIGCTVHVGVTGH